MTARKKEAAAEPQSAEITFICESCRSETSVTMSNGRRNWRLHLGCSCSVTMSRETENGIGHGRLARLQTIIEFASLLLDDRKRKALEMYQKELDW
jgi:hypothetical protein